MPGWQVNHALVDPRDGALRLRNSWVLATEAGDLVLDEGGDVRPLVHVYVDGQRIRDLEAAVTAASQIRTVAAIAGG